MSLEFKDIEQLFSDKLHNYEVTPPASVWNNIQKKKRKGVLFYFKNYLKVAAILLLLLLGVTGILWFDDEKVAENKSVKSLEMLENNEPALVENQKNNPNNLIENADGYNLKNEISTSKASSDKNLNKNNNKNTQKIISQNQLKGAEVNTQQSSLNYEEVLMLSKNEIKLRYLIYPSLIRFVYTNKKIGNKLKTSKDKEKEDNNPNSRYSMEILGGPSYASKRLSGNDYLLRQESENATMSIQTGLKLNYHFNNKFNLQSGVIIENRNEKIKYSQSEIQKALIETPKQVTVYHPVLPPRTITIIDSTYTDQVNSYNFNTTNKYTTINIPLVLGYKFALGKIQYRFSAGTLVNVYSTQSASVLSRSGNEIILVPYKENSKIKASVYSAFALQLPLSQTCNFISELSYYNNLTNRLSSESKIKQVNYGFNLSIGASFDLKK
jgi:hypothetical protein